MKGVEGLGESGRPRMLMGVRLYCLHEGSRFGTSPKHFERPKGDHNLRP